MVRRLARNVRGACGGVTFLTFYLTVGNAELVGNAQSLSVMDETVQ